MASLSEALREARAEVIEPTIGASPLLLIFSDPEPANCAAADPAGLLCTIPLPADWLTDYAAGVVSKNGAWADVGSAAGVAASWRIKDAAGTTCHMQGTAGGVGSGEEMELANVNIAVDQPVSVSSFAWTEGNP